MELEREGARRNGSPVDAFVDVVQSSQEVVLRKLDVLRLESERRVEHFRDETLSLVFAGLFAATAWILLLGAAVVFLAHEIGLGWALLVLGGVNVVLAFVVRRAVRPDRPARADAVGDEENA